MQRPPIKIGVMGSASTSISVEGLHRVDELAERLGAAFGRNQNDPTDFQSNGTRLTAKSSAFFSSGSGHVGKFSKSIFELPSNAENTPFSASSAVKKITDFMI